MDNLGETIMEVNGELILVVDVWRSKRYKLRIYKGQDLCYKWNAKLSAYKNKSYQAKESS